MARQIPRRISAFVLVLLMWPGSARSADEHIMFAPKLFVDGGFVVGVSGTLTGDGLVLENNARSISCTKERKECLISSIGQVGVNALGRLAFAYAIPITRWTESEVVAADESNDESCVRNTIFLERRTQTALWVQEPTNSRRPGCVTADAHVRHWRIEDPLHGWASK